MKDDEKALTEGERQEKKIREAEARRKRKKRIKGIVGWLVVILIVALVLIWFLVMKKQSEEKIKQLQDSQKKSEYTLSLTEFDESIDISGHVEPLDIYDAKFRSTGVVTGVFVKEGDEVEEGTLLATIDDTQQEMNLKDIENQIAEAKINGSLRNLEILEMRKKNYENALEYTKLVAPFSGIVTSVGVKENDYFEAGKNVITLLDRSSLKATVEISETDIRNIFLGQKATLYFDSYPGKAVEAYVSYIPMMGKTSTSGSSVVEVEIQIDNPPKEILPSFTFSGVINVEGNEKMLIIPSSSLTTTSGGESTVQVKKDDLNTETRRVYVKYLGEGKCQVINGLEEGETIVYEDSSFSFRSIIGGLF